MTQTSMSWRWIAPMWLLWLTALGAAIAAIFAASTPHAHHPCYHHAPGTGICVQEKDW